MILPLKREELISALEKTVPLWIQRTLDHLKLEVGYQSGTPSSPSISWLEFLNDLGKAEEGTSGYWNAFEVAEFLKEWKFVWKEETLNESPQMRLIGKISLPEGTLLDANQLLIAFRKKFLQYVDNASENFSRLTSNFEYTYGRSNRRLTFIIALLFTLLFNLPLDRLYQLAEKTAKYK
jgi:hypothetical protein